MQGRSCSCLLTVLTATMLAALPLRSNLQAQNDKAFPRVSTQPASPLFSNIVREELPARPIGPPARLPISPPTLGFPQIVRAAGTIFSGTVVSIRHAPGFGGQSPQSVAITFHIEHALRGAKSGQQLTITQWRGLWASGQRYQIGERVLLFLYPPSRLGLTSAVAGSAGRFNIDALGRVQLTEPQAEAFRGDPLLGGKLQVTFADFARSVQRLSAAEVLRP